MELALYLSKMRREKGDTFHQFAMGTNIDSTLLNKFERGTRIPTDNQAIQLANYLDVPIEEVMALVIYDRVVKKYGLKLATYRAAILLKEKLSHFESNFMEK